MASPYTNAIWHFRAHVINFLCCFCGRVFSWKVPYYSKKQQITANKIVFGPWKSATLMSSVPPSASFVGSTVQWVCRSYTLFWTSMLSDVTKGIDTPPHISRRLVSTHSARCHNNVSHCFCVSSFKCVRKRASEFAQTCKQRARYVFFSGDSLSFIFF